MRLADDALIRAHYHQYASFEVDYEGARRFRDGYSGKLSDDELEGLVGERLEEFKSLGNHTEKATSPNLNYKHGNQANRRNADERAFRLRRFVQGEVAKLPIGEELSPSALAATLNAAGVSSARGGRWTTIPQRTLWPVLAPCRRSLRRSAVAKDEEVAAACRLDLLGRCWSLG
jgi:hypothetical protein